MSFIHNSSLPPTSPQVSHNQESAKQGSHRRLGLSTLLDPAILQALLRAREREDGDEGGAGEGAAVRMPCAMQ